MSNITTTLKLGKFLKFTNEGGLMMLNIRARLIALFCLVHLQRSLEEELGRRKAMSLIYGNGYFIGSQAWDLTANKLGMKKKLSDIELLKYNFGQSEFGGLGKFKIKKIDIKNKIAIIHMNSIFAKEYVRIFGLNKYPVDFTVCGTLSVFLERICNDKFVCYETKCISKGDNFCEFVVKLKKDCKFNKRDKEIYLPEDCKDFKQLGGKKDPYLI